MKRDLTTVHYACSVLLGDDATLVSGRSVPWQTCDLLAAIEK